MQENSLTVDFTGVETGQFPRIPEGDYGFKIKTAKMKKGEESGKNYIDFQIEVTKGDKKGVGKTIRHTCSLQPQSLWNLKALLEACGKEVPSKTIKLNLDKMTGWEFAGTVTDDEYNGRKKSVISAAFPLSDLNADKTNSGAELGAGADSSEEVAGDEAEELFN